MGAKKRVKTKLHWGQKMRDFKREKRTLLNEAARILHRARFGSAYLPDYGGSDFRHAQETLDIAIDKLRSWWRKS